MTAPAYMLDTNAVSDLIRNPEGKVAQHATEKSHFGLVVSIITAAELRFGAAKRRSFRLQCRIDEMLERIPAVPFDIPADIAYAAIRAQLEAAGRPIGANDLLIAAHALALDVTLVTANTGEFTRVSGLRIENWLV